MTQCTQFYSRHSFRLHLSFSREGRVKSAIGDPSDGASAMNRQEAKALADSWVADSQTLLDAGRWHAAYYLIGYAIECGLKACVLAYIDGSGIIFQDKKYAERCFTHDIEALVKAANLEEARGLAVAANAQLGVNWLNVKDWEVNVRYQSPIKNGAGG
jgi:hypothetical protein